jgi:isopenicillin N synthase-like dioxygenase
MAEVNRDVTTLNSEYAHYDQVKKEQVYHLAETTGDEMFDEEFQIKTCDIGPFLHGGPEEKARFARELGSAMEEIGFAIITGHGIEPAYYQEIKQHVVDLFSQTSVEERLPYRAERFGSINQGYFPLETTSPLHPDLVEGWVFCRRAFDMDRDPAFDRAAFWPLPQYEAIFRAYVKRHQPLFKPLMQAMLMHLGCDPHQYDRKLTDTNFGFRLNYYPPISPEQDASGAGRILGHEDVDLFTLLPAPDVEGLQVLNRRNFKWIRLDAPPGSIIINTGDYMQRITNDIYPSTTHRVSKPRDPALLNVPRISFPIAVYVWEDEILEVLPELPEPKYEPIKAVNFHTAITSKYYGDDYAVDQV